MGKKWSACTHFREWLLLASFEKPLGQWIPEGGLDRFRIVSGPFPDYFRTMSQKRSSNGPENGPDPLGNPLAHRLLEMEKKCPWIWEKNVPGNGKK